MPDTKPVPALFADDVEDEVFEQMRFTMPPLTEHVTTKPPPQDLPDLSKQIRTWLLNGSGQSGKTTLARWLVDTATAHGRANNLMLAALDPANRTLSEYFTGTMMPRTADQGDTFRFLQRLLQLTSERRAHGVWDFGGGDLSLTKLLQAARDIEKAMRHQGVALVPVYMLTPRITDLTLLQAHTDAGFTPRTTLLILNHTGRSGDVAAFRPLKAQNVYRQAIERGAVEIEMPQLDSVIVGKLERKHAHFYEAASEETMIVNGVEAMLLRHFLTEMRAAFAPVETWLPWG